MNAPTRELLLFHLERRPELDGNLPAALSGFWPALLRRYRDLSSIRHDWPALLVEDGPGPGIVPLSNLVDSFLAREASAGPDNERLRRHLLRLESEIRALSLREKEGSFTQLWEKAAAQLTTEPHLTADTRQALAADIHRARATIGIDADWIGCGPESTNRVVRHLWRRIIRDRNKRIVEQLRELRTRLADLLRADDLKAGVGRQPRTLHASFGGRFDTLINFNVMSRTLLAAQRPEPMPAGRRERIERALAVLEAERFFGGIANGERHDFEFQSCTRALAGFKARVPAMVELVKAIRVAALELENRYRPNEHDAMFDRGNAASLTAEDLQWFPSYMVSLKDRNCDASEQAALLEILASDLPIKVLFQVTSLIRDRPGDATTPGTVPWCAQLAGMALHLQRPFVLQTTSSNLCQMAEPLADGLACAGPALFSVYSPETGSHPGIPHYLVAAAALESRAFPTLVFDPARGASWAACFSLEGNPALDRAWPIHPFDYEDDAIQAVTERLAFTVVDFLALDPEFTGVFRPVAMSQWNGCMVPVAEHLETDDAVNHERVPFILLVDPDDRIYRVVVNCRALRIAQRFARVWRHLRELAGIKDANGLRAIGQDQAECQIGQLESGRNPDASATGQRASAAATPAPAEAAPPSLADLQQQDLFVVSGDEATIETARCSSCNECTSRNSRMFRYNENKQAYIADVRAGTYRQLVECAETCKLALIHPGKPWNPDEPDLEDLLRRVEPFRRR
jgi:hypothetical protein